MPRQSRKLLALLLVAAASLPLVVLAGKFSGTAAFLPIIFQPVPPPPPGVEFRGVWVTRFDWTTGTSPADPAAIDEIVDNVATAGFNAIFFQVRGAADAFYAPGPEPWAKRVSGVEVGQPPDPFWDPLATMIDKAHARGIQVHAYINVYPVWDDADPDGDCDPPPPHTTPEHFYHLLEAEHGATDGKLNGVQWDETGSVVCGDNVYLLASPASIFTDDHIIEVALYLADTYDIDGLHLDRIRYGGSTTSCDPVSEQMSGEACFGDPPAGYSSYEAWQRAQVNGTVSKIYEQVILTHPNLWLTAAVWPVYIDYWGWGDVSQGYYSYYQDSKAWIQGDYIDALNPMIYGAEEWDALDRRELIIEDFQTSAGGRYIIPGIHGAFDNFSDIVARIEQAREIGAIGQAIFSYGHLEDYSYFDDLAAGPYATPAAVPDIPWR